MNNGSGSPEASSSSRSDAGAGAHPHNDRDSIDALWSEEHDGDVLGDDPLNQDLDEPLSFKRKQKRSIFSQPARLISSLTGGAPRLDTTGSNGQPSLAGGLDVQEDTFLGRVSPGRPPNGFRTNQGKDGVPLDWYVEGPGRRVGYEDLTAIDWIFEYTKERQRIRVLYSSASGLMGYAQHLLDASQVWVILVLTGIAVGCVAASIDVATDWLADLKTGYCSTDDGGAFYLSKTFCCLGYDEGHLCKGWKPWATALGISSAGGKWFIEYFFFLLFAITLALCASILVKEYAIYAKHSGIPEIKTVLGGFIIRKFLGVWTLATKSLGLVCHHRPILLAAQSNISVSSACLYHLGCGWVKKDPWFMWPAVVQTCLSSCFPISMATKVCALSSFYMGLILSNASLARKREVLSAAAASGISVAFGAPIGGVLFSLEVSATSIDICERAADF